MIKSPLSRVIMEQKKLLSMNINPPSLTFKKLIVYLIILNECTDNWIVGQVEAYKLPHEKK